MVCHLVQLQLQSRSRAINEALLNGYNYFTEDKPKTDHSISYSCATVEIGLRYGLKLHAKNLKPRSLHSYRSTVDIFCDWLNESGYSKLSPKELSTRHVLTFMGERSSTDVSNKTINTNIGYLHKLWAILVKLGDMQSNPFDVELFTERESDMYDEFTTDELQQIAEYLRAQHPNFFLFTQFIYYATIRPYHVAMYQRKQIDITNDTIQVFAATSTNKKRQPKQLLPQLKMALVEHERHTIPGHWYLFGKDFEPSETPYHSLSTRATELWYQLVQCDLGIKKKMYGLKHTAGNLYVTNNDAPDIAWLQRQMEHSNLEQTNTYVQRRQVKRIKTRT